MYRYLESYTQCRYYTYIMTREIHPREVSVCGGQNAKIKMYSKRLFKSYISLYVILLLVSKVVIDIEGISIDCKSCFNTLQ